jgi:hypothetical protein
MPRPLSTAKGRASLSKSQAPVRAHERVGSPVGSFITDRGNGRAAANGAEVRGATSIVTRVESVMLSCVWFLLFEERR